MRWQDRDHRPRAYNEPGHAHELTFSCYHRFPFLSKDRTCEWLAEQLRLVCDELSFSLWAYVFRPEHVYLVVCTVMVPYDTSQFLKKLKEPVSRKAVQFLKTNAPEWLERIRLVKGTKTEHHFWQPGRGFDRNATEPKTLLAMIDYVHLNPVRRGLVERARDWKWSSAGWYEDAPLNDLRPDVIPPEWLEGT
jgi:putative transposase